MEQFQEQQREELDKLQQTELHHHISDLVRSYRMENVEFIKRIVADGSEVEYAIIDRGNGEYTSMLKSTYDEMIAKQNEASTL